jgi:D-alanine-D-alanine ligase
VGLLYGGRSGEHEISVRSARSVLGEMDRERYEPILLGVARDGRWYWTGREELPGAETVHGGQGPEVVPTRGEGGVCRLLDAADGAPVAEVDLIFPVLHGPHGEDGTVQGLFEVLDVAYVGAGVLGSAIGMDKDVHKRLMREAGLPVVPFEVVRAGEWARTPAAVVERLASLGPTVFVKPANLGSSVGISKVRQAADLAAAIDAALLYDRKAVVEKAVDAREIECAVLGNEDPRVALPGEIVPGEDFYSYEDKYAAGSRARLLIPAPLDEPLRERIRGLAALAFRVLELRGLARVDFFLDRASGEVFVNEPNTMPGFTSISMYPKMWEASGLTFGELVSELIELAVAHRDSRPSAE